MFYMKKPLYTLLLLFFSSQLWSQDLNEGLIFHFPFADSIAEVESNTSLDIVGPQDLTENRYGTSNCAWDLSLNSNTIAFQLNDPEFESPMEEFTVALWMKLDGADSADIADYQKLVAMDDIHMALFDLNTPLIGCDNNCGIWDIEWNHNYFTEYNNKDTWHQLVWSFDAGEVKLYRDGELKAVDTLTDRPTITSNSITIGENFYGKMDDIRIYNRSLSESDVFDLYELEENCGGSGNCEIGSPELSNFECLGDSVYFVTLEFDYVNTSDSFDLETRTDNVGRYAYADLPLRLTLPFSGFAEELLSITDVEMPDCEFGRPELSNFGCLGDSVYFVTLEFDYVNTSDSFDLETRTDNVGRYAYADLPLRLTLPFSGLADELLSITDVEMPDCSFAFEFDVDCGGSANCEIGSPELSNFECLGDSVYFVTLEFDYVNTSDSFDLETRTDNVGRYAYADLPLRLTLPVSGVADELLSITDVEMPDCAFAFEFDVDCGTTSISQFNKRDVLVYPNPFQDRIKVRVSSQEKLNYELLTSFGRKVKEGVIRSEEFVVTRQLQSGYFLLHIWGEGMDEWIPLIKTE